MAAPRRVLIAGGTGMIGRALVRALLEDGSHSVVVVGRSLDRIGQTFGSRVDAETYESLHSLHPTDVVVNLVGENVGAPLWWNESTMNQILHSRVTATRRLAQLVADSGARMLTASGVSIYGSQPEGETVGVDEGASVAGCGQRSFLTHVALRWEEAAATLVPRERIVFLRFGVVLERGEGALYKMALPFYLGMGGRLGGGEQIISWVSLVDCVRSIIFLIQDGVSLCGPVNIAAGRVTQSNFASSLGRALWRPALVPTPSFALRLALGSHMADSLVLCSHSVRAAVLEANGFRFKDCELGPTLKAIFGGSWFGIELPGLL